MKKVFPIFPYLSLMFTICLVSCLKQNLDDYRPDRINDLTIDSNILSSYLLNTGAEFALNAKVSQSKPGSDKLIYKWYYYPADPNSQEEPVIAGNNAELKMTLDMNTGKYFLILEVTDPSTGAKTFKKIALTVKNLTSEGWILLTRGNNITNLSIVSSQNEVYQNFLEKDFPSNVEPEKLSVVNDWDAKTQPIVIKTSEPNLYFLDFNTFNILGTAKEAFDIDPGVAFTFFGTDMYFQSFYLIDANGALYETQRKRDVLPNFPDGFAEPLAGSYKAAPFLLPTITMFPVPVVVYDETGKRFLYQPYGESELKPFPAAPHNAPFDLNNFKDRILETTIGADDVTYVVARSNDNKINLYSMFLNNALDDYPANAVTTIEKPNGTDPEFFAFSGKLPLLYFIAGQELYLYRISEKKIVHLYSFPANEKISALKMFRETITQTEADNPAVNNRLAIAANSQTEGVFYTFDLTPTGALKGGKFATRNDGFEKIIDIAYKEQK